MDIFRSIRQDRTILVTQYSLKAPLSIVIEETIKLLDWAELARKAAFRPSGSGIGVEAAMRDLENVLPVPHLPVWNTKTCKNCQSLPRDKHCTQMFKVTRLEHASQYNGYVLTHALGDQRLQPKQSEVSSILSMAE